MDASTAHSVMNVEYQPAWLTWVSSATTCLKALDVDCDLADVAGFSGYAFCLSIHRELCPSGPTVLDWQMLQTAAHDLGRTTTQYMAFAGHPVNKEDPAYRANCRAMFDFVKRETAAGRPVIIWGTYVPEFGVATGTGEETYLVSSFRGALRQEQPPIGIYDLDLVCIHYALAFPGTGVVMPGYRDRNAIFRARRLLTQHHDHGGYGWGIVGYDTWISALEGGRVHPHGAAYNAQCWWEARHFAAKFIARVAARTPAVAAPLILAAQHLSATADALREVAQIFMFPPAMEPPGQAARADAAKHLRTAQAAELKAIDALNTACSTDWVVD